MKRIFLIIATFLTFSYVVFAQNYTQTVKGRVVDMLTQQTLPGVNITIPDTEPLKGTITDMDGYFKLENIPIGRINLNITMIGYKPIYLNNLNLTAGKEMVLHIEMEEQVIKTEEIVIKATKDKTQPINEVATISSRTFTIEETQRFAGARNDVSRLATNYAGVNAANDAENGIVIRGNSPNGLLWLLEGMEIPNPNHFGMMGATGGPVSMLNPNVLSNSDFMTAAFPAEYGNAFSGVFDLRLRDGNYEKHEFLGQVGFNGFEAGVEGPISKKSRASYIANYRYSTLGLISKLGVDLGTGTAVPYYQDLTFKLNIPTSDKGKFNVWGLGGIGSIAFEHSESGFYGNDYLDILAESGMGVMGGSYTYFISENTYSKISLSANTIRNYSTTDSVSSIDNSTTPFSKSDLNGTNLMAMLNLNSRINSRHYFKFGASVQNMGFDVFAEVYRSTYNDYFRYVDNSGNTNLLQAYSHWQFKVTDRFIINSGLHYSLFTLNNSFSIEPRIALKYEVAPKHALNIGYGLHSKTQQLYAYFWQTEDNNGIVIQPNLDMDLLKTHHAVFGYDWTITPTMRIKAETYYQDIFNAAVETSPSAFSLLNSQTMEVSMPDSLQTTGEGYNYGAEITVEKFLDKGLYYLLTTSLFESKYKGSNNQWRSTAFDTRYVVNLLGGKEFKLGKNKENRKKERWITIDGRLCMAGGQRYTPVNIEKSLAENRTIYNNDEPYSKQFDDYFRFDLVLGYRWDSKKVTQEMALSMENLTNHKNPYIKQFNLETGESDTVYQLGLFPMLQYRITF